MCNKKLAVLVICMVCLTAISTSQSSDRVIIVSPRVGTEIDQQERLYYYLFQSFDKFQQGVFYVTPDDSFYVRIRLQTAKGEQDTVIQYSKNALMRFAEKIDHIEEIIAGTYKMGSTSPKIIVADGEQFVRDTVQYYSFPMPVNKILSDQLPFDDQSHFEEEFPKWSFGIGYSTYDPDFSELRDAFIVVANRYKSKVIGNQFFSPQKPALNFSPLFWYTLSLRLSQEISLSAEVSQMKEGEDNFSAYLLSLFYYPPSLDMEPLHPFLGIGYGRTYFSTTVPYGVVIDTISKYQVATFDKISSSAGEYGYLLTSGCDVDISSHYNIQLSLCYLIVPEIKTTLAENIPVSVILGSIVAAVRFQVVF